MASNVAKGWEGWVYKKGSLMPSWKRRYMVLEGREVSYYDQAKRDFRAKEKGAFRLAGIQRNNDIANGMTLRSDDGSQMQIYTESVDEFVLCFNAMSKAVGVVGGQQGSGRNVHHADEVQDFVRHSYAGWMEKEGERMKTWKRRYFVLSGTNISYFEKFQGEKPKGGGRIERFEYSDRPFGMVFHLDNNRALNVAADSDLEMKLWVSAVCKELGIKSKDMYRPPQHNPTAAPLPPIDDKPTSLPELSMNALGKAGSGLKNISSEAFHVAGLTGGNHKPTRKSLADMEAEEAAIVAYQKAQEEVSKLKAAEEAKLKAEEEARLKEEEKPVKKVKEKKVRQKRAKAATTEEEEAPKGCCVIL
ncbi:Aste57867_643 [Aphanomyces stellatus]|uniref:Aste57867_643 protein n=1 Tax=Aphanomyces stellatus TaxID=120398 RepID=A0A485K6D6_9STRA|nr:hypothetical protein As57867_000642 [Aphanomyces stellatus]VFT77868.1 Aste57867_643 [Aphanomyces stellatus]